MNKRGRKKSRAWIWILVVLVVLGIAAAEPNTETVGEVRQVSQIISETDVPSTTTTTTEAPVTTATAEAPVMTTTAPERQNTTAAEFEEDNITVYIPRSEGAECYHFDKNCSRMKNPREATRGEAIRQGYRPCSKCAW